jgi:transposase
MFIVGIDIGKRFHEAAVTDASGNMLAESFKFKNDSKGFNSFLKKITAINADLSQFEFGMEATGHYWLNLYCKLIDLGCIVHVINPIQSDALRSLFIRKTKNDSRDSLVIAELIRFGRYSETKLTDPDIISLKELTRQRYYLVDCISDIKRKVICLIDKIFPEYENIFADMFGATSLELLHTYTCPEAIANVDTDTLSEFLKKASKGRFGLSKAEEIQNYAKNTFGSFLFADSSSFALRQLLEQIKLLERQLDELDSYISQMLSKFNTTLTTINGIGPTLAASIIAEIGDINRFDSPEKLAAFAGIDPSVKQSGEFNGTKNHMSKRGSPYLRRALYLAAVSCNLHNPAMHAIYEKKRSQGKHHNVALSVISRKLVNIIYTLMKSNKPYEMIIPD